MEHAAGDVDGDRDVVAVGPPARALADGGDLEDVQGQRPHHVGVLDDRDEVVGADRAAAPVLPAHQCLGGVGPARLGLGDRLEVDAEALSQQARSPA